MNCHVIRQLLNKPPIYSKLIGLLDLGGIWREKNCLSHIVLEHIQLI